MAAGPTQRSMDRMRKMGFIVYVTEKWISQVNIRKDAFGFGDILCARENEGIVLVQTTDRSNMAARRTKILELPEALRWIRSGGRILLHGWHHAGKGKPWKLNEEEIEEGMFSEFVPNEG